MLGRMDQNRKDAHLDTECGRVKMQTLTSPAQADAGKMTNGFQESPRHFSILSRRNWRIAPIYGIRADILKKSTKLSKALERVCMAS